MIAAPLLLCLCTGLAPDGDGRAEKPTAPPATEGENDAPSAPSDGSEADPGAEPTDGGPNDADDASQEPGPEDPDAAGDGTTENADTPDGPPPTEPRHDALEHLTRAQDLEAAGDLPSAEAEVSVAISLQPDDPTAYLARAQIRMALADQTDGGEDPSDRRARASLLRLAAEDVDAYLRNAELPAESRTWFETRREALLRDADALDPPAAPPPVIEPPPPEPKPVVPVVPPDDTKDNDPRQRSRALISTGAVMSGAAVGFAAAGLRVHQTCSDVGLCSVEWKARPAMITPAAVLMALGTTTTVLGIASAPGLSKRRTRVIAGTTTIVLGSVAAVLGTVTGAIAGSRWSAPISPSDDEALGSMQTIGNISLASFTAAVPLITSGLTAWLARRNGPLGDRVARRSSAR